MVEGITFVPFGLFSSFVAPLQDMRVMSQMGLEDGAVIQNFDCITALQKEEKTFDIYIIFNIIFCQRSYFIYIFILY